MAGGCALLALHEGRSAHVASDGRLLFKEGCGLWVPCLGGAEATELHPLIPSDTALQEAATARRELRAVGLRVAARLSQLSLARAWASWAEYVEARRSKAEQLRRAVHAWRLASLRAAFAGWRGRWQVRRGREVQVFRRGAAPQEGAHSLSAQPASQQKD